MALASLGIGGVMAIGGLLAQGVSTISSVISGRKSKKQLQGMTAKLQAENAASAAQISRQLGSTGGSVAEAYLAANGGGGGQGSAGNTPAWARA